MSARGALLCYRKQVKQHSFQADFQLNDLKEAWPPGTVAHTFSHSTPEAVASVSLQVQDQPEIHIKLQASQSYIARPCLKTDELRITDLGCGV